MDGSVIQITLIAVGGAVAGGIFAWSIRSVLARRRFRELATAAQAKLDEIAAQGNKYANAYSRSRAKIRDLKAADARRSARLNSALKKAKLLARNVRKLQTERENTKAKLSNIQGAMLSLKEQTRVLQTEFEKSRDFYKRELLKSLQKRKDLEAELVDARAEQEAFSKAVESSSLEHGSTENMVIAAQLRLGQIEVLERNVGKLESENEQLRQEIVQAKKEFQARERDLAELEELRLHNKQLVRCAEALEDSRKEHEADADTLRLKLDDLEKNFADMERQQNEALKDARKAAVVPLVGNQR